MALTPLGPLPTPTSRSTFNPRMDDFINVQLPRLVTEVDGVATAFTLNATNSTSTTSNTIGTGSKTLIVETNKSYLSGMFVIAADASNPSTNYLYGQVTSYNIATGELVVDVIDAPGSGTINNWRISQTAPGGVTTAGATFTGDIVVPDEAYSVAWDGNFEVPTKNAVYDELSILATDSVVGRLRKATNAEAIAGTSTTGALTPSSMRAGFNASGSAPLYACRAWVNFDGTTAGANPAPMTIRGSGNVSSVTRTATGFFQVNFTVNLPNENYAAFAWGVFVQAERCGLDGTNILNSSFVVRTASASANANPAHVFAAAFG
jgi:hypothetical protein